MNLLKAILVLENESQFSKTSGNAPSVLVDVLGKSVLQRTVEGFTEAGIVEVVIVAENRLADSRLLKEQAGTAKIVSSDATLLWRTAEQQFEELSESAANLFIVHMNAYYELDWNRVLQHHMQNCNKVTRILNGDQDDPRYLDVCVASASRRNDAAFFLRSGMQKSRTDCLPYILSAAVGDYVNLLRHEADLRQLTSAALHNSCRMKPAGKEVKPGVWLHPEAQVEKRARLVAPIYVGRCAKVCSGAVVTRGTSLEHHTVVGNKTVVENATILPYTNLGPGLDVSHSVVGERHIFHLQRNVCTPIQDPKLVSQVPASAGSRAVASMAKLLRIIPGLVRRGQEQKPEPAAESAISYKQIFNPATQQVEVGKTQSGFAVMRRYGNQ